MNEKKCLDCGSIIKAESEIVKCSCGSKNLANNILSIKEITGIIENEYLNLPKESPFSRTFTEEEIQEEEEVKKILLRCYEDIQFIIEKYLDMDSNHIKIIALWIIGTYFHDQFNSYPYLYLNAMRGSGKTRLLNLIAAMSNDGSVQNSMTEAVLFRTTGTLCIDEAEGFGRKGKENLIELLNSGYKKGTKVRRMRKKKTLEGEEQIVEEFNTYRPIALANISGMDNVLGDRCIKIILERSINEKKTRLIENLLEDKIYSVKRILSSISRIRCSLCSVVAPGNCSQEWNNYVLDKKTSLNNIYVHYTLTTLTTLKDKFEKILQTSINGRDLELSFSLLIIATWIDGARGLEGHFEEVLGILDYISQQKKEDESIENLDLSLYDMISQKLPEERFISMQNLTQEFREHLQTSEEWLNNRWMGRALSRLKLVKERRRLSRGVEVKLDYEKARQKTQEFTQ